MKIKLLALALALSAGMATLPTYASDNAAALFDQAVAGGLPQTLVLPGDSGIDQTIVVTERLDAEIDTGDESQAVIYTAEVDGRPATILRLGDQMDIAFDDAQQPEAAPGRRVRRSLEGLYGNELLHDFRPVSNDVSDPAEAYSHADGQSNGLHVWLFLHDNAGETNDAKVINWYTSWWVKDMRKTVMPGMPVRVSVRSRVPGLTDLDYQAGSADDRLFDLRRAGAAYAESQGEQVDALTKIVLLVGEPAGNWDRDVLGLAKQQYHSAFISNRGHRHIFAHEMGHLLGATHEGSEARWLCVTNMRENVVGAYACQVYSGVNDERIRGYLGEHWPPRN